MTLVLALMISSALTPAWGADVTAVAFQTNNPAPIAEQASLTNRILVIGLGALTGAVVYSIATRDWSWAWGLWGGTMALGRRVAGVFASNAPAPGGAAAEAGAATSATAIPSGAAGAATTPAIRTGVAATAAAPAAGTGTARAITWPRLTWPSWSTIKWSGQVAVVTASALTGAFLGHAIYDKLGP